MWLQQLPNATNLHDVVAWWDFDPSATLSDRMFNGHVLTNTSATHNDVLIHGGRSFTFDGASGNLQTADATDINVTTIAVGGFSIETWIFPDSEGENSFGRIIDKADGTVGTTLDGYSLLMNNVDTTVGLLFAVGMATTNALAGIDAGNGIAVGAWYHIVAVLESDKSAKIYVNGANHALDDDVTGVGDLDADTSVLRIGQHSLADTRTFDGEIGPVRIWNKPLTAVEIGQIYNKLK